MPNLLSRLFRRRQQDSDAHKVKKTNRKSKSRNGKSKVTRTKEIPKTDFSSILQPREDTLKTAQPLRDNKNNQILDDSKLKKGKFKDPHGQRSSTPSTNPVSAVLSPRNVSKATVKSTFDKPYTKASPSYQQRGPVDLDDSEFDDSDHDENHDRSNFANSGLSYQRVQQFNMQAEQLQSSQKLYGWKEPTPTYGTQRMPDGQLRATDDLDQSESSASEFNLSTDAEDEEYNTLKLRVAGHAAGIGLDNSGLSSQLNYPTDDENPIFPALHTDDEGADTPTPEDDIAQTRNIPLARNESDEDIRAWGLSPSSTSSRKENDFEIQFASRKSKVNDIAEPTRRQSTNTSSVPAESNDFANFANFENNAAFDANFDNAFPESTKQTFATSSNKSTRSQRPSQTHQRADGGEQMRTHRPSSGGPEARRHPSSSALTTEPSLTDLLAQANQVGRQRRDQNKQSSASVNSAPAITAQYLRQYHGLSSARSSDAKSATGESTSVSDIISSLEATNAARLRSSSSRHRSNQSVGSRDSAANASVRSAKERIRERRRRESTSSRRNRPRSNEINSDDSDDNDPSENWIMDEVTGVLGPRSSAADLESLGGRSNRSRSSNKSHRSHRSHRSSRRRHRSSNESVDSRGSRNSRTSRNSRNSRYSHKSTRSYISQMSEQSRSVANDLLRLEMQLAMVGSQENVDDGQGRSSGSAGGSVSATSRTSRSSRTPSATRRSSAITKRSKISVMAPPGKLGIILANKADSKGTVVSGVRTSSVLAEKISPGDRIIAIDGEDVSRMTVSEITTIMARKSEFERTLTVLTTPKHMIRNHSEAYAAANHSIDPEGSYSSFRR
mmetsp:Transcript_27954/g.41284  ORF Transcript_27954/g.41284 Transcript_27954/m.41284 type:complete len:841 (-) Transcript_27954:293-2815(-)